MAAGVVAATYGHALFELAVEQDEIDSLVTEADTVLEVFRDNPEFERLLAHPRIDVEQKLVIIDQCFRGKLSDDMTGFLSVVVKNGRQNEICASLADFKREVKEYRHIGVCTVTSALPLTEEQKKRLTARLIETTAYESFEMNYVVDAKLIGGLTVRIGDRVLDSSIKSQLNGLKKSLQALSVE